MSTFVPNPTTRPPGVDLATDPQLPADAVKPEGEGSLKNIDPSFVKSTADLLNKFNEVLEFLRRDRGELATPLRNLSATASSLASDIAANTVNITTNAADIAINAAAIAVNAAAIAANVGGIAGKQDADDALTDLSTMELGAAGGIINRDGAGNLAYTAQLATFVVAAQTSVAPVSAGAATVNLVNLDAYFAQVVADIGAIKGELNAVRNRLRSTGGANIMAD